MRFDSGFEARHIRKQERDEGITGRVTEDEIKKARVEKYLKQKFNLSDHEVSIIEENLNHFIIYNFWELMAGKYDDAILEIVIKIRNVQNKNKIQSKENQADEERREMHRRRLLEKREEARLLQQKMRERALRNDYGRNVFDDKVGKSR